MQAQEEQKGLWSDKMHDPYRIRWDYSPAQLGEMVAETMQLYEQ